MDYWIWLILLGVTYVLYKNIKMRRYFTKHGVPQISGLPYFGGLAVNLFSKKHINDVFREVYDNNKEAKYVVLYSFLSSMVVIRDLDLIKSVLVKNFDHFTNRKKITDDTNDPLMSKSLTFLSSDKWKNVRSLLSPAFTSSKMRSMHVLMSQCAENFTKTFLEKNTHSKAIDVKDVFGRFTTDVVATCAFGIEVNSLNPKNDDFYMTCKRCSFTNLKFLFRFFLQVLFPNLTAKLGIRTLPKEDNDFFVNVIKSAIKTRKDSGIKRPDMLQLMMDSKIDDVIEITAQAFAFLLGGFDATSDTISTIAYMLAINPDVQEKLRSEVDAVMKECNGKPTYEAIGKMSYLDAVFNETMRMHPLAFLFRVCTKDFEFPPASPNSKPITIKAGQEVFIPITGIHNDTSFYENPRKFDPERYLNKKITNDVYNLAFGLGPRMCIGNRFTILQIKTLFVHLLAKCNLEPCKKTCIPFEYNPNQFLPSPKGGFWLKIEPRSL